jgi:hypothetical protein
MSLNVLKVLTAASVCLSISILRGEIQGQPVKSSANAESWVTDSAKGCSVEEQVEVDKGSVADINTDQRAIAIRALENKSAVLLSSKQLKLLAGSGQLGSSPPPDTSQAANDVSKPKPYLVRAVSASTTNRSISVHWCHHDLLVFSGSLGGGKPQKDPIIVFLKATPERVFVSYMAVK